MTSTRDQLPEPDSEAQATAGRVAGESVTIPVIEEHVQIGKQVVETGRIRIIKDVREEEVTVDVPVSHDELDVERVVINQYVDTPPPAIRTEGDTTIISILHEVVVVEKRLMLAEELRVTRRQVQTRESQQVTLRKEEVTVERIASPDENLDSGQKLNL